MRIVSKHAAPTAVLILAVATVSATAQPDWTPVAETPITDIGSYVFQSVALTPGGGTLVGGTTVTAAGRVPAVIERPARGAAWAGPSPLAAPSRFDVGPLVARNARGDGLAVWGAVGEPLLAAVRVAGAGWGPARPLGARLPTLRTGRAADTVKVTLSAAGAARVVVANCGGSRCQMTEYKTQVRRLRWVGAKPRRLPASATATLQWEMSSVGHVVAAWLRPSPLAIQTIVQRPRDTKPAPPQVVTGSGGAAGPLDVEVGERGEAAISWTGAAEALQTSVRLPSDLRWRESRSLVRTAPASGTRIALACDGSLVAAWVQPGGEVRATTAAGPGGPFATSVRIGIFGNASKPVSVAPAIVGAAGVVTWARAEQESAGMSIARLGDPDDAFRGENPDFGFRDAPAPVFATDGFGIVVGASDNALRVQEIAPDPERVQCAR
jgi:hypothetical protein